MKKFLVILMVAIFAIGCVFADGHVTTGDKAQLTINAEIKTQYPVFSLQATSWTAGGTGTDASLGSADVMVHGESPLTPQSVVIGDDVLTSTDTTVEFTIAQTTLSRVKGVYTLTVEATDLVISQITGADGTTKAAASDDEKSANYFDVSAAPTISKKDVSNITMDNATAGKLKLTYDGKKVASDTELATFEYTWTHNEDAAPGDYVGTVTLTIESVS